MSESDALAAAAPAPAAEMPAGFCADCVRGYSWTGTPTGTTQALGSFKTVYVAPAPGGAPTKGAPAIILLTDVFGFSLPNPKMLADRLANDTGVAVYVPDLFDGNAPAPDALPIPNTPEEERAQKGFMFTLKKIGAIGSIMPWFIRNRPATKLPHVKALAALLTGPEHGHTKLGAVGYCYGGRLVADLDQAGLLACGVYAHPSLLKKADLDALSAPASFALAESDDAFDDPLVAHAKTALDGRVANELVVYPGTCHGFAARGDLNIESVRKGAEGAHTQAANWFRKYLL